MRGRALISSIDRSGTLRLANHTLKRLGYGAMQLAGPGVFGLSRDQDEALGVLREAAAAA